MRIEWLPAAKQNLESQITYIAEHDPRAAIKVGDAIETAVARLADNPQIARAGRVQGTRELVVTGTPFVAVYRIDGSRVAILRVLHGAQRWPPGVTPR